MKKILAILFSYLLILAIAIPAFAGTWQQDDTGWWYENTDSSYPANTWEQIDDCWYYFYDNGYMATGWIQDGGKWYFLNSDGAMVVNTTIDGYTLGADGAWIQPTTSNTNSGTNMVVETNADQTTAKVWIATLSGQKYHRQSCRTIKNSDTISLTVSEALSRGYESCKVCNPSR